MDPATLTAVISSVSGAFEGLFSSIGVIARSRADVKIQDALDEQAEDLYLFQQALEKEKSKRIMLFVLLALVLALAGLLAFKKK